MKTRWTALTLAVLSALGLPGAAAHADPAGTPACVKFWGQPIPSGPGYNHVVTIENGCERAVACVVSTDVAPDPIQATVESKKRVELTTFRGSPARVFTPRVKCSYP
jgi:hypothetical protein